MPTSIYSRSVHVRHRFALLLAAFGVTYAAVATPPVITSPPVMDVTYNPEDRGGFMYSYAITATNSPTSFGAATPLGSGMSLNQSTGIILGDPSRPGIYSFTVSATNAEGTGSAPVQIRVRPAAVEVRSTPGLYRAGDQIRYNIVFNAPVVVTGAPFLIAHGRAVYSSGSGSSTLTFVHTVTPADAPTDEVVIIGIDLNGGTIRSVEGLDVGLILPLRFHRSGVQIGSTPTVSSESRSATVGILFTYAAQSSFQSLSPVYTAAPLPPGLLLNPATGVISGTPTTAGTYNIVITATAPGGSPTASGTLTLTVAAADVPPPPPLPPPPPPPTPSAQTIAIVPAASVQVGQPVTLNASATSGLPVVLSVVSGNATVTGSTLTVNDTSPVVVRGTQPGNASFQPATAEVVLSASRTAQAIDFVSPVSAIVIGQPIRLSATSNSGLPTSFSIVSGNATINGDLLTVTGPGPVVVRATQAGNNVFDPASADIVLTSAVRAAQSITLPLPSAEVVSDRPLTVSASASSGLPVTIELVSGPATVSGTTLVPTAASGTVTIRVRQEGSDVFAPVEVTRTLTIIPAGRLVNLSARVHVREGDASRSFIAGFVVAGNAPKRMLVRAIGPALGQFGVQTTLPNPQLRVHDRTGAVIASNDDWSGTDASAAFARLGAFGLPAGSRDAALLVTLAPGAYTLQVLANGGEGVALAEIYDASDVPALESQQVINLSTRAYVESGERVLASGFVVTGSVPKRVLIRGIGPALAEFGVGGVLADPVLRVFRGEDVIAQNDNWQTPLPMSENPVPASGVEISAAATAAGAFPLTAGSRDAAVIMTLAPGAYTAIVSGVNDGTGAGLVEVYELPGI